MHGDIHQEKGMLCQNCHTTLDVHGDMAMNSVPISANTQGESLKLQLQSEHLNLEGKVAMAAEEVHIDNMECYSCHVKVDYSQKKTGYDWVAAGRAR